MRIWSSLALTGHTSGALAFVREWKGERQRATHTTDRGTDLPLVFQPGEAFQFDWSEDRACVGGERIKLQVAHMKLSHSRAARIGAYLLQTHDLSHRARTDGAAMASLFHAHWPGFVRGIFEPVADCPSEPPRLYRRAKLLENCPLWNGHKRSRPRSRVQLSSARVRFGCLWNTAMTIRAKRRALMAIAGKLGVRRTADPVWARPSPVLWRRTTGPDECREGAE